MHTHWINILLLLSTDKLFQPVPYSLKLNRAPNLGHDWILCLLDWMIFALNISTWVQPYHECCTFSKLQFKVSIIAQPEYWFSWQNYLLKYICIMILIENFPSCIYLLYLYSYSYSHYFFYVKYFSNLNLKSIVCVHSVINYWAL